MNIVKLGLDELATGWFNVRDRYEAEGLAWLKASVEQNGVCVPLLVRMGEKGYEVLDGGRRLYVARELGLKEVPAVVVGGDGLRSGALAWILNFQRESVSFSAEAAWLGRVIKESGWTVDDVGVLIGRSSGYVRSRLAVLEWPLSLQERCSTSLMSFSVAREYARLGESKELELALIWDDLFHASYRQASAYVDSILLARETVVTAAEVVAAESVRVLDCEACHEALNLCDYRNMRICGNCQRAIAGT